MSYVRIFFLAAIALLAGKPLLAQTQIGAIGEAGVSGAIGVSVKGVSVAPPVQLLLPSVGAASLSPSLIAPAIPALPQDEAVHAAIEALSPDHIGKISGESAKALSGRLLGLEEGRVDASGDAAVEGRFAPSVSDLDPSARGGVEPAPVPHAPAPSRSTGGLRRVLADQFHYARLWVQNYHWYAVTHIVNMWPTYLKRWKEAKARGAANVSHPRAFFAHMRVAATSGRFYVLGAAPLEDDAVIAEFRKTLVKWYDAPGAVGPKELAAFDAFAARAKAYNSEHRALSNMRKHIRDALIKGSILGPAKLAPFFDSLLVEETVRETSDFQNKGAQKRILDAFKKELTSTLAEEPEGAKGRIRAAILLGSFATGSAGPKSDFDVELLTDGGSNVRSEAFIRRLTERWIATGHHARNPVAVHDFPYTPTRGVVDRVHTGDFIVISLDPELTAALQRKPGEYVPRMVRKDSLRGKVGRAAQYGLIIVSTYVGELKARFASARSGH